LELFWTEVNVRSNMSWSSRQLGIYNRMQTIESFHKLASDCPEIKHVLIFVHITALCIRSKTAPYCKHKQRVRHQTNLYNHHATQTKCYRNVFFFFVFFWEFHGKRYLLMVTTFYVAPSGHTFIWPLYLFWCSETILYNVTYNDDTNCMWQPITGKHSVRTLCSIVLLKNKNLYKVVIWKLYTLMHFKQQ
jgi:hypothetical protein